MVQTSLRRQYFSFELPEHLIAKYPLKQRDKSRLLEVVGDNQFLHKQFNDFYQWLNAGDVVVFNNTKVIPARLFGQKQTGGQIGILIERQLSTHQVLAHIKASKVPKVGTTLFISNYSVTVVDRSNHLFILECQDSQNWTTIMDELGHIPLPPYIQRKDEQADREQYQTVYAKHDGAVAAPTAGLHFESDYKQRIEQRNVNIAEVTLHVGAGTFQPVRVDDISQHQMHSERFSIDQANCNIINQTRQQGGRVVAIGTTSVRVLESATNEGVIRPMQTETDIFITPGYQFKMVDAMITNFHLPESTLLMLVSAFCGRQRIMNAYMEAIKQQYRFYSYGDAMLLTRNTNK